MDAVYNAQVHEWLFAAVAMIAVPAFIFLSLSKDANLKRRLFPKLMIAMGAVFAVLIWFSLEAADRKYFPLVAPIVAAIIWLNMRAVRFCDQCGATLTTRNLLAPPKFCEHCGSELE